MWVGGRSDKTKLTLISTLVEVVVEVELGNMIKYKTHNRSAKVLFFKMSVSSNLKQVSNKFE